jgi:putative transposase
MRFQSVILPRWCRRSPKVAAVLALLYLHGLSSSDFVPRKLSTSVRQVD